MHHDTTPEPDGTTPRPATPADDSVLSTDATRDLCMSVFDRWRCGRADGHVGPHQGAAGGSTASWNDPAAGRRLRGR